MLSKHYIGNELELFQNAIQWKAYWFSKIQPFIKGRVLEVGAGLGANSRILLNSQHISSLYTIEPDELLVEKAQLELGELSKRTDLTIKKAVLTDIPAHEKFDTIVYIDVLEHIEDDKQEIEIASSYLNEEGRIIVLSPAFGFLYSEFDRSIGHHHRYNKKSLTRLTAPALESVNFFYLDSVGFFASLANKLLLRQSYPTLKQIKFWDRYLIRVSKLADPVIGNFFGRSIVGVWKKRNT